MLRYQARLFWLGVLLLFLLICLSLATGAVFAQTKWDLAAAYPATNFHSVNIQQFADDVDKATGGKLKITSLDFESK